MYSVGVFLRTCDDGGLLCDKWQLVPKRDSAKQLYIHSVAQWTSACDVWTKINVPLKVKFWWQDDYTTAWLSIPLGSIRECVSHGSSEGGLAVHHSPCCLEDRIEQTVTGCAVPEGKETTTQLLYQLWTPVDDTSIRVEFCERVEGGGGISSGAASSSYTRTGCGLPFSTSLSTISSKARFWTAEQNLRMSVTMAQFWNLS